MAAQVFWISLAFIFYVYLGYPLLLLMWRQMVRRPVHKADWEPCVSLLIAAYNERDTIENKIANCLNLDYPKSKLQIILSLDAPTDGTAECAHGHEELHEIEVLYSSLHLGKAAAINAAAAQARGEILMFTDARQRLDPAALRHLVANFKDPSVGGATGELVLLDRDGREASDGVGIYWRYEKWLRSLEMDIHSVVGATGAIYAVRAELFRRLPEDTILDDVMIPMRAVLDGKRIVLDPSARAYDMVCPPEVEYRRKVRTLMGNYQLACRMPELLAPWRNPLFVQYLSHKVGRLLVPYFMATLFVSNLFLVSGFYLGFLLLQIAWYVLAGAGSLVSAGGGRAIGLGMRPSQKRV